MSDPFSILVVEDEIIIAARLSLYLEQLGHRVAAVIARGENVLAHCRETPPDLLLLDVQLRGEMDGIDVATQLREAGFSIPIIYLTANVDEGTFERARPTRPRAFLEKPFRKRELERAVSLALEAPQPASAPAAVEAPPESSFVLRDRIFVRHKDKMVRVALEDILYAQAERSYCQIFTTGNSYLLSVSLGELEEQLDTPDFARSHRSYLVNLRHIDAVGDNYLVIGERELPLSRRMQSDLLRRMNLIR